MMALSVAALLAGTLTYVAYKRSLLGGRAKLVKIVAAAQDLPLGATLAAKDVTLVNWPADVPVVGSFSKTEEVVGRPLIFPLKANEPILAHELAVAGSGIGLSAKIPEGMRATAVRSNDIVGVAGFLYPGSHVDVLATFTRTSGEEPLTRTVLQDVEVLTAGQATEPDPEGKPHTVSVVTLLLSPEDSQKLLLTSSEGSIQFVLRNGADKNKAEVAATRLGQVSGIEKPAPVAPVMAHNMGRRPAKRVAPTPAAPPPREPYVMEVIQGTKRSEEKFPE